VPYDCLAVVNPGRVVLVVEDDESIRNVIIKVKVDDLLQQVECAASTAA